MAVDLVAASRVEICSILAAAAMRTPAVSMLVLMSPFPWPAEVAREGMVMVLPALACFGGALWKLVGFFVLLSC